MKQNDKLSKLVRIAGMLRDKRMHALKCASAERNRTRSLLQNLAHGKPEEPQTIAEAQATLRYNRWADVRRAEINVVLAAKTAEWLQARSDAERALGQAEVLKKIYNRAWKQKD